MRRTKLVLLIVFIVSVVCCSDVFAVAPFGPPVSNLGKGNWAIGVSYTYSEMDLRFNNGTSPGGGPSFTLDKVKTHAVFVDFARGFSPNWEAFIRVGAGSTRVTDNVGATGIHVHDPDSGYALGFGTKVTFWKPQPNLKFGGIFQMLWTETKGDGTIANNPWKTETNMTEIQLAIGPEYKLNDKFSLYGGAFLNIIDGEFDAKRKNGIGRISYDIDNDNDSLVGGFIGTSFVVNDSTDFNFEWQHTTALDLIAMKLIFKL